MSKEAECWRAINKGQTYILILFVINEMHNVYLVAFIAWKVSIFHKISFCRAKWFKDKKLVACDTLICSHKSPYIHIGRLVTDIVNKYCQCLSKYDNIQDLQVSIKMMIGWFVWDETYYIKFIICRNILNYFLKFGRHFKLNKITP